MKKIKVALAGVGNCASSLVQGLEYYKGRNEEAFAGLMHTRIGDWGPSDIEVVAAFDIDMRKVGKDVSEAIFEPPRPIRREFHPRALFKQRMREYEANLRAELSIPEEYPRHGSSSSSAHDPGPRW